MKPHCSKTEVVFEKDYKLFVQRIESTNIIKEIWLDKVGLCEYSTKKPENTNSNVIYAAIITSRARIKLYKALKSVLQDNGRLLYCDTDSIFASFNRNVLGEKHGEIE
jgi:hypothetical protein